MLQLLLTALTSTLPAKGALNGISLQARADGHRVFVDSAGREVLLHGTNAVVKGPPYHPDSQTYSTDISMSTADFEQMNKLGLNLLRLGLMWPGYEPVRYNTTSFAAVCSKSYTAV